MIRFQSYMCLSWKFMAVIFTVLHLSTFELIIVVFKFFNCMYLSYSEMLTWKKNQTNKQTIKVHKKVINKTVMYFEIFQTRRTVINTFSGRQASQRKYNLFFIFNSTLNSKKNALRDKMVLTLDFTSRELTPNFGWVYYR